MRTADSALIARGRTAEIYAWGEGRVLKLFFDWCPESWARQEARVSRAVHAAGLPVPAVDDMVRVDGRDGIIFERLNGHSMVLELKSRPWKLPWLARRMAELQAAVHRCEVPGLPSLQAATERRIRGLEVLPAALKDTVLDLLCRLPEGHALCHCDFHPDNILMTPRGPMILDWMTAAQGNPLADVARTSVIFQMVSPPPGTSLPSWLIAGSRLADRTYRRRYLQLRGGSPEELEAWMIPTAAARLEERIPGEQEKLLALIDAQLQRRSRLS